MPSDPLGLQDSPLFGGLAKAFAGLDSLRSKFGGGKPKPGTMSPNYAQAMYAGELANRQGPAPSVPKAKPASKGAPSVKKPAIKKDKSGKKSYASKAKVKDSAPMKSTKERGSVAKAKLGKEASRPSSSGHATVPQDGKIKSRAAKGKAADKMVSLKKRLVMKKKV